MLVRSMSAGLLVAATLVTAVPPASAQNNTVGGALIGGATGAIIGGAVTGRAGGAVAGGLIGGAAGAMIGNSADQRERRQSYYYRSGHRCFYHYPNGRVVRVDRGYCR